MYQGGHNAYMNGAGYAGYTPGYIGQDTSGLIINPQDTLDSWNSWIGGPNIGSSEQPDYPNSPNGELSGTANGDAFAGDDQELGKIPTWLKEYLGNSSAEAQRRWEEAIKNQEKWQKDTQEYNAAEAEKQRAWEEMMSNTAYQRAIADMEKTGINPILMFGNGLGGAGVPAGATAHSGNANYVPGSFGETQASKEVLALIMAIAMGASSITKIFGGKGKVPKGKVPKAKK